MSLTSILLNIVAALVAMIGIFWIMKHKEPNPFIWFCVSFSLGWLLAAITKLDNRRR